MKIEMANTGMGSGPIKRGLRPTTRYRTHPEMIYLALGINRRDRSDDAQLSCIGRVVRLGASAREREEKAWAITLRYIDYTIAICCCVLINAAS